MMILVGKWIAGMMDHVLFWLLMMPRDMAILIVAIGTSIILTLARKWTTNQGLMRRCTSDLKRLKQLKKQAKRAKDKLTVGRITTTVGMIQIMRMKSEGWGLLASLLPIILLASWAFERLDYIPAKPGQLVDVRATYPITAVNQMTWMTAQPADKVEIHSLMPSPDGKLAETDRPTQAIRPDDNLNVLTGEKVEGPPANGLAVWRLKLAAPAERIDLKVAFDGRTVEHPLRVGQRSYEATLLIHDAKDAAGQPVAWADASTWVAHKQAWFLESVPGVKPFWRWWVAHVPFMAPWLTAYLLICIPFVPLLRKVTGVH